jgi:hypothetical protein
MQMERHETFLGKHFVNEPTHAAASAVECFKCMNCGTMFPTEGNDTMACPVCGRIDSRAKDEVLMCSTEDY